MKKTEKRKPSRLVFYSSLFILFIVLLVKSGQAQDSIKHATQGVIDTLLYSYQEKEHLATDSIQYEKMTVEEVSFLKKTVKEGLIVSVFLFVLVFFLVGEGEDPETFDKPDDAAQDYMKVTMIFFVFSGIVLMPDIIIVVLRSWQNIFWIIGTFIVACIVGFLISLRFPPSLGRLAFVTLLSFVLLLATYVTTLFALAALSGTKRVGSSFH